MKTGISLCKAFLLFLSIFTNPLLAINSFDEDSSAYDFVVAADSSGDFTKVQDAINAVPSNKSTPTVIFIKPGIYKEKILVTSDKKNLKLVGESYENTILTYDDHAQITDDYASTKILAEDFFAEELTFQNTIDSRLGGSQAAALRVDADRAIFFKCRITGFQDTYYLRTNTRSYMKDCIIDGTTDFIYGSGIALFENCTIRNRKDSHITASSQPVNKTKYGFVFKDCVILKYTGESVSNASLGRPWGDGAHAVYLNCHIGKHIRPQGFAPWSTDPNHKYYDNINTCYFGVYDCSGDGFKPSSLLSTVHQLSESEAAEYTKENIFAANTTTANTLVGDWIPVIENDTSPSILPPKNAGPITGETDIVKGATDVLYTLPEITNATGYVWTLPAGATGESTTNTILVSFSNDFVSGTIRAKGQNENGYGTESSLKLTTITGIHQSFETLKNVYPNPVNGELHVHSESGFDALSFYNIEGNLVFRKSFNENIKIASLELNIPKGLYILKISNSQSSDYSKIILE